MKKILQFPMTVLLSLVAGAYSIAAKADAVEHFINSTEISSYSTYSNGGVVNDGEHVMWSVSTDDQFKTTSTGNYVTTGKVIADKRFAFNGDKYVSPDVYSTAHYLQGNINGKDLGALTGAWGSEHKFTAKTDGTLYVFARVSYNKRYYVYAGDILGKTGNAWAYTMDCLQSSVMSYTLPDAGDGTAVRTDEMYFENENKLKQLSDMPGFSSISGTVDGIISFKVKAGEDYYVYASGSKIPVRGYAFVPNYNVNYIVDGTAYKTVSVPYYDEIPTETAPVKDSRQFSGWSGLPDDGRMPAEDINVTGAFQYDLIYKVDDSQYKKESLFYGTTVTPEAEPTKKGHTFSGWSTIPATMPAEDVTVTGSFTVNVYDLIYNVDGAQYKKYEIAYGSTIIPETEPSKTGYTFSGWSEIPATMPDGNVEVNGTFTINTHNLVYKLDGEIYHSTTLDYGTPIEPLADLSKTGYTFSGWSTIPATMPDADVEINGSFTINTYNLVYKVDGTDYQIILIDYATPIVPLEWPSKTGYTFSGWSAIPATMPAGDFEVNGTFTANKYNIVYKVDGEEYQVVPVDYGTAIVPLAEPTKLGYTFSGWSAIPATMPANDIEVEGTFSAIVKLNAEGYATFSFDSDVTVSDAEVYTAQLRDNIVWCTKAENDVPANTGVILKGEPNATVTLTAGSGFNALENNDLKATTTTVGIAELESSLVLSGSIFKKYTGAEFAPYKAYLPYSGTSATALSISFTDGATAISGVKEVGYDESKGIIKTIENGKLVIVTANGKYNAAGKKVK